ncbi:MAG TPA: hypothetical protein VFR50_00205, partial [Casimicrobiaceae bacterium]|nr:hypothetical protein [Casimicrobiaceae bacterium]
MTKDNRQAARWAEINGIFHRALEISAERRKQFVDEACRPELRAEVLSLLEAHLGAGEFLERPTVDPHAVRDAALTYPLVGRRVGHYQIERVLGAGGMG